MTDQWHTYKLDILELDVRSNASSGLSLLHHPRAAIGHAFITYSLGYFADVTVSHQLRVMERLSGFDGSGLLFCSGVVHF